MVKSYYNTYTVPQAIDKIKILADECANMSDNMTYVEITVNGNDLEINYKGTGTHYEKYMDNYHRMNLDDDEVRTVKKMIMDIDTIGGHSVIKDRVQQKLYIYIY